ncbi:MAG: ribonuclease III family protein [Candidatus Hodarchaeota archaeon]
MDYEFLIKDLNRIKSQKSIGTDKGLAKIGDGIVNLAYSVAKSIFLTKNNLQHKIYRTGSKVSKQVLANALKNANMKDFAKNRADAHDLADTGEALVAYIWLNKNMTLDEIIILLSNHLSGDLTNRSEETQSAIVAFTNLFNNIKKFLPEK